MELITSLIGRYDRRSLFLKRKDSNAGEAARALEELRGSLYNELRTSEGAKRQQQRLCGPIVALTFNFLISVGIIMGNKLALSLLPPSPPTKSTPFVMLFALGVAVATVTDLEFNLFGAGLMPWLDPPGAFSFKWGFTNTIAVLISALLGFLLQWSGALALGATSATSHVVLGQFKTCVILLGGYLLFDSDPGYASISGAFVAICGMSIYTSLNMKGTRDTSNQLPEQTSSNQKPKTIKDQNEKIDVDGRP
ncbi:protein of unknown function DUF250 [Cynara cardunculus var. scolymus]|uniref:Sugar phosphate transporter domain-containing protein n=1 Tax=Cynara cardunculus var. scolymus TaxID=59895 RepID=A0A103YJP7_CYNCS|nr:protein of unknown function DUF250 [Cynara cardunculus var. scolymus]